VKPRTQIIWVAVLLVGVAALASLNRAARSDGGRGNKGACCPFMSAPDALAMPTTNETTIKSNHKTSASTNRF